MMIVYDKLPKIINAHSGSSIVTAKEKNLFISFFAQKLIRLCAFFVILHTI